MYPITQEVQEIFENNRQVVDITFDSVAGNLHLTEANVLSGGLSLNRYCVSGDNIEIGSVVAGELQLTINNSDGSFNDVTFEGSEMFVRIGSKDWDTEGAEMQYIPLGYFTVDEAPRKLDSISFSALDRLIKFDKAVNLSLISFPITVQGLLSNICSQCGVTLAQSITGLPNYNYSITAAPTGENLTYRQLLSWIAQITGTCAFIDWNGQLVLKWYTDTSVSIPPSLRYSSDLKENAIIISGVRVVNEDTEYISGTDTYAISIEGNELIQHHYSTVASALASNLSGFTYTPFEAAVKSMPFLYPLDKVSFVKGEDSIPTIITNTTYVLNGSTTLEGRGETSKKKTYAEMNPLTSSQNVVINNGLTRVSATLTQEFTAADGAVVSKIANAENKYDESEFTAGTITLRGYNLPTAAGYKAAEHNGEYYLNQSTGYVYLSNGSSWNRVATLTLMTTVLNTRITQTDSQIRSDVAATYSTKTETTNKANAAENNAKGYTDTQITQTTSQINTVIDQTAEKISLEANARLEATVGYSSKNLLEITNTTKTQAGVTFTVDKSTGTITASNTCTASEYTIYTIGSIVNTSDTAMNLYISGCADGGSTSKYYVYAYDTTTNARPKKWNGSSSSSESVSSTDKKEIQILPGHTVQIRILVKTGYPNSTITFKPMVRDGGISDSTFEPYHSVQTQITETNSRITQTASDIRLEVSTAKSEAISTAATDATTKANNAKNAAISDTDQKLQSYSTTTQMNSAIDQKANSILLASSQLTYGQRTKNLIPFILGSAGKTLNGITIKRYGTGYKLTGTATANAYFTVYTTDASTVFDNSKLPNKQTLPNGSYIVSGGKNNGVVVGFGDNIKYYIEKGTSGSNYTRICSFSGETDGKEFTVATDSEQPYVRHYIWIRSGTDMGANGTMVYPMIRDATIPDSSYTAGVDAGAYMCSYINLTPEKLELDTGKLIISAGNFQLDSNGTVTITSGIIKTSNYAAASGNTKTVGGQINLSATGSTLLFDTANFKITGAGAVTAEDATFTNCTITGGTFTVNTDDASGQIQSKIILNNTNSGDSRGINISSTELYLFQNFTGASNSIKLSLNAASGVSQIQMDSQYGPNYNRLYIRANGLKFDTDISPYIGAITFVDTNSDEQNALSFWQYEIALGNENSPLKLYGSWIQANHPIQTSSDARKKNSIEKLDNRYLNLIRSLVPRRFKYNDNPTDRYHSGFIAQELQENMKNAGLSYDELAALVDDGSELAIRYGEMIPLLLLYIRYLEDKLNKHLNERGA